MNVLSTMERIPAPFATRAAPRRSATFISGFVGVSMKRARVRFPILLRIAAGSPMST